MRTSVMFLQNSSKRKIDRNNNDIGNYKKVCLLRDENNSANISYDYNDKENIEKRNSVKLQNKTHGFIKSIADTIKRSVKLFHYILQDKFNKTVSCSTDRRYRSIPASLLQDYNIKEEISTNHCTKTNNFSNPFSPYVNDNFCLVKNLYETNVIPVSDLSKFLKIRRSTLRRSNTHSLPSHILCTPHHVLQFLCHIEDDPLIALFLKRDVCRIYADKYLIAMVLVYFIRAKLTPHDFTRHYFFAALYLAHDMEEDDEEAKFEFFPFSLGPQWKKNYSYLLSLRDDLFWAMDCRAVVAKRSCEQVMNMVPNHWIWNRERPDYHGYVTSRSVFSKFSSHPIGPYHSPLWCKSCLKRECRDSEHSYILYSSTSDISSSTLSEDEKNVKGDGRKAKAKHDKKKDSGHERRSILQEIKTLENKA